MSSSTTNIYHIFCSLSYPGDHIPICQHPLWYWGLLPEQLSYYIYLKKLHTAQYTGAFWGGVQVLYLPQMEKINHETLHMFGDPVGAHIHQI